MLIALLTFVLFAPDIVALVSASSATDKCIDGVLLVAMAVFSLETFFNTVCRRHPGILTSFMDTVLIVLIAADLSWVQQHWINYNNGNHSLSTATVVASRAGKMTRLLHAQHFVRTTKVAPTPAQPNQ